MKKYLITSALPYANGPIHFGHLAGAYFPADIFNRHHKLLGHKSMFICGSDEHGVAIMLNAQNANKGYREYVDEWHQEHAGTFQKFNVEFDFFGQTSADYHKDEVILWFKALHEKGLIEPRETEQLFCKDCQNHLPDRFVEGICHSCDYPNARGDECPHCGIIIDPIKLKDPHCKICSSKNIERVNVTQWYLLLSKYHKEFRKWFETKKDIWRKTVYPFVEHLTKEGLHDRAITRDLDWGIDVPLPDAKGKKLYVWFDAPIGYVSNTKKYLEGIDSKEHYLNDWWNNSETELTHFLAKDNVIFHTIIFPVMGMASEKMKPPYDVPANQYLNLEGKQFSKSSGWYIDLNKAYETFGADALRYYLISILPEFNDASFCWRDFSAKINGELANNIGNLVNRCLKFFSKNWNDGMPAEAFAGFKDSEIGKKFSGGVREHKLMVDNKTFKKGLEKVMSLGQSANTYFSDQAPWAQFKTDPKEAAMTIGYTTIQILVLGILFAPYLPGLSDKILGHYGDSLTDELKGKIYRGEFDVLDKIFGNGFQVIGRPEALVPKIDETVIDQLEEELNSKVQS